MLDTARFSFIAEALNAGGGFSPKVIYANDEEGLSKPASVTGPCHLVPYPREGMKKFAGRAAVAVYENHLRSACERFVSYLSRMPPLRTGTDSPLVRLFIDDADWSGNALDVFWSGFMVQARARGTMLLLMDAPDQPSISLAEQISRRAVPYISSVAPERVAAYRLDRHGRFESIGITDTIDIDGQSTAVVREYDAAGWRILDTTRKVVSQGPHSFGRCPMLFFSETGKFPYVGNCEQLARLSVRLFNVHSELDEILRAQTFSILAYQVKPEERPTFESDKVAATVSTHNMLIHGGDSPVFIAPPDGPAERFEARIATLTEAIRRIAMDVDDPKVAAVESGLARQLRFQAMNAALSSFAQRMEDLERQVWDLFNAGTGTNHAVVTRWSKNYTLMDPQAEIDKLLAMRDAGMPREVLLAKQKQIAAQEFAALDADELERLLAAIDEQEQERHSGAGEPGQE